MPQTMYFSPPWFYLYDIGLEAAFAIISLIVAIFAFHIYKISEQKQAKLFGVSFLLISISYALQTFFNFMVVSKLREDVCRIVKIQDAAYFDALGVTLQIIFMTVGLALLTYMTLKTQKPRVFWLLLSLTLLAILSAKEVIYMYYVISAILLVFLSWHFMENYRTKRQKTALLIAVAFLFLLFRDVHFVFSFQHELFYVAGRIAELIAYVLILWNFYLVRKT